MATHFAPVNCDAYVADDYDFAPNFKTACEITKAADAFGAFSWSLPPSQEKKLILRLVWTISLVFVIREIYLGYQGKRTTQFDGGASTPACPLDHPTKTSFLE